MENRTFVIALLVISCAVLLYIFSGCFREHKEETLEDSIALQEEKTPQKTVVVDESKEEKQYQDGDFKEIYKQAVRAVVSINVKQHLSKDISLGTGFYISKNGFILTNYHVVDTASDIEVAFQDGRVAAATVHEALPHFDLALLKTEGSDYDFLMVSDATEVAVGAEVVAIGNPLGLDSTMTQGIISSKARVFEKVAHFQIDVPVNPGNSGGPLLNKNGQVIGVVSASAILFEGLNFAIPINYISYFPSLKEEYQYLNAEKNERFKKWIVRATGNDDGVQSKRAKEIAKVHLLLKSTKGCLSPYLVFENGLGIPFKPEFSNNRTDAICIVYYFDQDSKKFCELYSHVNLVFERQFQKYGRFIEPEFQTETDIYGVKLDEVCVHDSDSYLARKLKEKQEHGKMDEGAALIVQTYLPDYDMFSAFEPITIIP